MAAKRAGGLAGAFTIGKRNEREGKPVGTGTVLKPGYTTPPVNPLWQIDLTKRGGTVPVAPSGDRGVQTSQYSDNTGGGSPGGSSGGISAAQARANAAARSASRQQNDNTRALVNQQKSLIDSFGKQRDTKLGNIASAFAQSDATLMKNYGLALAGLEGNRQQNEMAEGDQSFANIANAVRERGNIADQAASQGAGETDLLRSQLQAFRNFANNQSEISRSFNDTLQSINNSVTSLNSDTATSRTNLFNQAEADREQAWANYANQTADAWTQIANIENSNTNIESETSEGYNKLFADAGSQAAAAVQNSYKRQAIPAGWTDWEGKGEAKERKLTSSNRAAAVNLGGPVQRAEGATLRKWN
ncbi:hypothetical protein SEA_ARAXXI_39 [Microbacterium phage Araxxi]|uniref:Uncharacterized protein n=1 Tax=Microbacterium phage Araxxi TaxID=2590948 RepID=A0A516KT48_9CAUD|nr:hypothetical protein HWC57_gp39 [Microbacterium phage Araxxi]QDP44858.1 hypothetical protein SEA_ARAXXI_39 [Microbacterium phage Araxxi]